MSVTGTNNFYELISATDVHRVLMCSGGRGLHPRVGPYGGWWPLLSETPPSVFEVPIYGCVWQLTRCDLVRVPQEQPVGLVLPRTLL